MKKINFILALFIINISAFAQQALWGQQNIVSPEIHENNTVTFRLKAPKAIIVEVTGDFLPAGKNGEAGKASLTENKDGIWEFTTNEPLVSELYSYSFIVDELKINDPSNVYMIRDVASVTNVFIIDGEKGKLYSVNNVPHGSVTRCWYNSPTLNMKRRLTIYTPAGYETGNKKYPVLMVQYSGPASQEVTDSYGFDWEHYLASKGIMVVSVDGRGTGARGEAFRKCTYLRMGELESRDQVEAAQALGKLPYIDKDRIAIWGWSFGGYNTLMALSTGNGTFKVGIAVAPPTDWKYYDSVYTERFMRTPQENFEGYAATSPLRRVKDLQGKLLLVHGTADDNVHFMQTMEYAEALVQANKQFDMHVYKDRNHSIYGGNTRYHLYTKMANYLFNNL